MISVRSIDRQFHLDFARLTRLGVALLLLSTVMARVSMAQPGKTQVGTQAALQAAPQAANESGSGLEPTEQPQEDVHAEARERQAYRHSATVQWFAKLLHVDVETAATLLEYVNFGIVVVAIGIPLFRVVPGVLRKRSARLSFDIEVAKAKSEDANARLKAVEEKMAGLDAEIAAIRKQMEEDMRTDEARSKASLEEETARIVAAAGQEIAMAGAQARRGLKQFAGELAVDRAMSRLKLDADTDRALFAEFASDMARAGGNGPRAKGDRN